MTTSNLVYERPKAFTEMPTHYCPGCTHGVAHRLVAEVLDEMGIVRKTIGVAPVGCAVFAYNYFDTDFVEAPHGRAPAMAAGIKRVLPDRVVFTYQGDGDLASIGMGEIVHAAARGEKITVIFINNANYGMTGGQFSPLSGPGILATTAPYRTIDSSFDVVELAKAAGATAAAAGYAFLYIPLVIVVVYSFNNSRLNAEWVGFTLDWYDKLAHNEEMLVAAGNSLLIALIASLV